MNDRIKSVAWCLLFGVMFCNADLSEADSTGTVTYDCEDLISSKQGTIEFWFTVPFAVKDQLPGEEKYTGILAICTAPAETGGFNLGWFSGASYYPDAGLYCSIGSKKLDMHGAFMGKFMPPAMEWHHLAVTWKGDTFTFYRDGEKIGDRICLENIYSVFGEFGGEPLLIGDKWHTRGRMIIDELRLSTVARRPDELGFHGELKVDPFTTLLENFEAVFTPDGQTATTPAWSFTGAAGVVSRQCRFVEGRFGKALALYPE